MKIEIGNGGFGSSIASLFVVGFFIPVIWPILIMIAIAMWIMGLVADHQIAQIPKSSKMAFHVPVIPSPAETSVGDETAENIIKAAKLEAARIADLTPTNAEGWKKVYEHVLRRECEKRGVKVSKVVWKS
jgi:hypothetical protein